MFWQVTSDCTIKENQQGGGSVMGGENSTMFSSTANTSSFSALGLGTSTYSLFSTPSWVNPVSTCGSELEGNGLSSVMGVPGNNSLSIGQQVSKCQLVAPFVMCLTYTLAIRNEHSTQVNMDKNQFIYFSPPQASIITSIVFVLSSVTFGMCVCLWISNAVYKLLLDSIFNIMVIV